MNQHKKQGDLLSEEWLRYSRQVVMPEFGREAQRKLKSSAVLVVGAGGLGSPLLLYLCAAGVGRVGVIDPDEVDVTNLHRQVLYGTSDVGIPKVEATRKRLMDLNPNVHVEVYKNRLTSENAMEILSKYDLIADGSDNFPTRYLVNDACVLLGKVNVYASIFKFDGQLTVFNAPLADGERGPNYRDLFPAPPGPGQVPSCAEGGVLGVLPGIMGSLQATEVIKLITGIGEPLVGRMLVVDALHMSFRTLKFEKIPDNPLSGNNPEITELIDYDLFCGLKSNTNNTAFMLREMTVQELHKMQQAGEDFQLIDVREPYETEIATLNGLLIPMGEVADNIDKIDRDKTVIIHCRSGMRSANIIEFLQENHNFDNLYNLKGGILAWSDEIDSSVAKY